MKFQRIGFGYSRLTKKGEPAIVLSLDKTIKDKMANEDFTEKIWIFKNRNKPYMYEVVCPMADDYVLNFNNLPPKRTKVQAQVETVVAVNPQPVTTEPQAV